MKKNDCFSLEKRKNELEKELRNKDMLIKNLRSQNAKYPQSGDSKNSENDDSVTM